MMSIFAGPGPGLWKPCTTPGSNVDEHAGRDARSALSDTELDLACQNVKRLGVLAVWVARRRDQFSWWWLAPYQPWQGAYHEGQPCRE